MRAENNKIIMEFSRLISTDIIQDVSLQMPLYWIWALGSTVDPMSYEFMGHTQRGVFNERVNIFGSQGV